MIEAQLNSPLSRFQVKTRGSYKNPELGKNRTETEATTRGSWRVNSVQLQGLTDQFHPSRVGRGAQKGGQKERYLISSHRVWHSFSPPKKKDSSQEPFSPSRGLPFSEKDTRHNHPFLPPLHPTPLSFLLSSRFRFDSIRWIGLSVLIAL